MYIWTVFFGKYILIPSKGRIMYSTSWGYICDIAKHRAVHEGLIFVSKNGWINK